MTISRRRWIAKKLSRAMVVSASSSVAALRRDEAPTAGPRIRALTYHGFGRSIRNPYVVDPAAFDAQMRYLAERDLAVSLQDVLAFIAGERTLPNNAVLVTIDDGFSSVFHHAAPILQRYGVPAVAYVTTSLMGIHAKDADLPDRFMTWDEVAGLQDFGIEVGSHSHNHDSLGEMSPAQADEEGQRSREVLERELGRAPLSFAYPYGMKRDHTPTTAALLRAAGYTSIFVSQHGTIGPGSDASALPRVKVEGGEGLWLFRRQCLGALDAWRVVDDLGWWLQRQR